MNLFSAGKDSQDFLFALGWFPTERGKKQILSYLMYNKAFIGLEFFESVIHLWGSVKEPILKRTVYFTAVNQLKAEEQTCSDCSKQLNELSAGCSAASATETSIEIAAWAGLSEVTYV